MVHASAPPGAGKARSSLEALQQGDDVPPALLGSLLGPGQDEPLAAPPEFAARISHYGLQRQPVHRPRPERQGDGLGPGVDAGDADAKAELLQGLRRLLGAALVPSHMDQPAGTGLPRPRDQPHRMEAQDGAGTRSTRPISCGKAEVASMRALGAGSGVNAGAPRRLQATDGPGGHGRSQTT